MNDLLKALLVSGSLGALVGLERQWDEQTRNPDTPDVRVPAGLRTFTIVVLLGTLAANFSNIYHPLVFAAGLLAVAIWLAAFVTAQRGERPGAGLTTASSAMMVYLVGGLVYAHQWREAVIVTIVLLVLLAGKSTIHGLSKKFTREDVRLALQFLAVSGVVLPMVPDKAFGPYDAINLHSIWMMVVLVSGLGFAGYVAVRVFGHSLGILLTGIAGGVASSTATTLSMSKISREEPEMARDCALAIGLSCTVMLWRVEVLVLAVSPTLALALIPDLALLSVPGLIQAALRIFRAGNTPKNQDSYRNPLSLKVALQFAALYAVVVVLIQAANAHFGAAGLLVASFFSGLTDLAAISLSIANLLRSGGTILHFAAACIILATIANSLIKLGMALSFGDTTVRKNTSWVLGSTILLGAGILAVRLALAG